MGWTFRDEIPVGIYFPPLSRPALGPTQPPVQWVTGLFRGKMRQRPDAVTSTPSSAVDMEEYSYISAHTLGHTESVTEMLCLLYM